MKSQRKEIKMIAKNPATRKYEEVFPEDEVSINAMTPMFWCGDQYCTIPGATASEFYTKWLRELNRISKSS